MDQNDEVPPDDHLVSQSDICGLRYHTFLINDSTKSLIVQITIRI